MVGGKAKTLSTSTVQNLHSILSRSVSRAQARDKVKRNVVLLCEIPQGQPGRPSRALPLAYAEALLTAAESDDSTIGAYIVVSLLLGARTEELRALTWAHVDLDGAPTTPRRRRHTSTCGDRFEPAGTPRRASRAGPWPCRLDAWPR